MFREAFRRLWLSRRSTLVATLMITAALTILGAFLLLSKNLGAAIERQAGSPRITIYLTPSSDRADVEEIVGMLDAHPESADATIISPVRALETFRESFPDLGEAATELEANPFPWSIEAEIPESWIDTREYYDLVGSLRRDDRVDEIQQNWDWIERLRSLVRTVQFIGLSLGGALALAAAFMIANVIRLTMVLYQEEIGIMRLVGATERMIRFPFLLEGMIQGVAGGGIACGLIALLYYRGLEWLDPEQALIANSLFTTFLSPQELAALIGGGALAGLAGSWLAARGRNETPLPTPD